MTCPDRYLSYWKGKKSPADKKKTVKTTLCLRPSDFDYFREISGPKADLVDGVERVLTVFAGRPLPAIVIPEITSCSALVELSGRTEAIVDLFKRLKRYLNAPLPSAAGNSAWRKAVENRRELGRLHDQVSAIAAELPKVKSTLLGGYEPPVAQLAEAANAWLSDYRAAAARLITLSDSQPQPSDAGDIRKMAMIVRLFEESWLNRSGPSQLNDEKPPFRFPAGAVKSTVPVTGIRQLSLWLYREELREIKAICRHYRIKKNLSAAVRLAIDWVRQTGCTPFTLMPRTASVELLAAFEDVRDGLVSLFDPARSCIASGPVNPRDPVVVQHCEDWNRLMERLEPRIDNLAFEVRCVARVITVAAHLETEEVVDAARVWVGRAARRRTEAWALRSRTDPRNAAAGEHLRHLFRLVERDEVLWRLFNAAGLTATLPESPA